MKVRVIVKAPTHYGPTEPHLAVRWDVNPSPPAESLYMWTVDLGEGFPQTTAKLERHGLYLKAEQVQEQWPSIKTDIWYPFHQIVEVRPCE